MSEWVVPGYDVQELLGFGSGGEVWRARERSSGTLVALRRIAGGDRDAVATVRAHATVVRSLPTPHLVRLRTTTCSGLDDVLVLDHAAGGSLTTVLRRRGRLEPGEVVTAVAPLAEALGQAHAHGLVHGRARPGLPA
jgi:serine/threonine protein kinase